MEPLMHANKRELIYKDTEQTTGFIKGGNMKRETVLSELRKNKQQTGT